MNIVFRVDSSSIMGSGHVMRCLVLADELYKQQHKIFFICRELTGNLISQIKYSTLILPRDETFKSDVLYINWQGATQELDAKQSIKVIPENTDLLIVDSYALDCEWHKRLRRYTQKIMIIDDLANREFDCDILVNQNAGARKEDYTNKVPNNCELLLGCDFALLRPEFAKLRKISLKKRTNTREVQNIMISMGGSDVNNITYEVLRQLDDNFNFNVVVVLGGKSFHNKMIQNYAKGKNIKVVIDATNMSELMFEADLAIGAGGSTSWERCCLGLPALLFITAENQRVIAENLERSGAIKIIENLQRDLQTMINDFALWQAMVESAQVICDGLGVKRIKI
jgi:UDP-2,4-diacetamido-2,4,6-trideoxy-beta-L-altropyranose hydrolase